MATINLFPNDTVNGSSLTDVSTNLKTYTVATAPASGNSVGDLIYVSNGDNGQPAVAMWDGSNWKCVNNTWVNISVGGGT